MSIPTWKSVATIALSSVFSLASTAAAQTAAVGSPPTFELSAGYQFLHAPDQNFPVGFNLDGARHFGPLGLVAEVGWAKGSDDGLIADVDTTMWNVGAGPRWTGFGSARLWPYGQVILGAAVARSSVEIGSVESTSSESAFMVQPGVGATYMAGDGLGVFGQVDYRRTFFDEPDDVESSFNNQFRVVIGLRMILD